MKTEYSFDEVKALLQLFAEQVDNAYRPYTRNNIMGSELFDGWLENYNEVPELEEETISFTFQYLHMKMKWEDFCDMTGTDFYTKLDRFEKYELFYIPISMAKKYDLI